MILKSNTSMKTFKLEDERKITSGFITPEDYFENFSNEILRKLPENETKVFRLSQQKKVLFLAVAAVFIIGLLIPIHTHFIQNKKELDEMTLENYLAYQPTITQYDLINELEYEDINTIDTKITTEKTIEDLLISNSNIENLLLE